MLPQDHFMTHLFLQFLGGGTHFSLDLGLNDRSNFKSSLEKPSDKFQRTHIIQIFFHRGVRGVRRYVENSTIFLILPLATSWRWAQLWNTSREAIWQVSEDPVEKHYAPRQHTLEALCPGTLCPKTLCPGETMPRPMTCHSRQYAPGDTMSWTQYALVDIMPRRHYAQGDIMPQWMTCPSGQNVLVDNMSLGTLCPRATIPWMTLGPGWH